MAKAFMFSPDTHFHETCGNLIALKQFSLKLAIQFRCYWDKEKTDNMTAQSSFSLEAKYQRVIAGLIQMRTRTLQSYGCECVVCTGMLFLLTAGRRESEMFLAFPRISVLNSPMRVFTNFSLCSRLW